MSPTTRPVLQQTIHNMLAIRHITVILNPTSGRGQGAKRRPEMERLLTAEAAALAEPPTWEIRETNAPGHAQMLAADAAKQGADIVAAAGGDGTIGEVLNGLIGTDAALGLLPLGTGNDCCRTLGIHTDLPLAVKTLFHGSPQPLDAGQAKGRWFLNVAGCGFDAIVAERVNRGFRTLHGTAAYIAAIVQSLVTLKAAHVHLTLDGEKIETRCLLCSVANARSYGGGMMIAPEAQMDDGLFDVCLVEEAGRIEFLRVFPRVFKGTHISHPKVKIFRARHVLVESETPLPVLVDGEVLGTTPVEFTLSPRVLRVMVPKMAGH